MREILEREGGLGQIELLHGELMAHPQRHTRERDGEGVQLDPLHVLQREEGERGLRAPAQAGALTQLVLALPQALLEPPQLPIGDVEEVARSTGRIEDHVIHEVVARGDRLSMGGEILDPLAPGAHDRRLDDLLDVGGVRVVRRELPLRVVTEPLLEKRPEDLRVDLTPIEPAGDPQQAELLGVEVDVGRALEEPAVGVGHARVETVLGPWATRVVENLEEAAEVVGARARAVGEQLVDDPGEAVAGDLTEILSEHRPDALEQEVAQHAGGAARRSPSRW